MEQVRTPGGVIVIPARQHRFGARGDGDHRHREPLRMGEYRDDLGGFARVGQYHHHIAAAHHAKIAVRCFAWMQIIGGAAGGGERCSNLAGDMPRLAHAGQDDAAARADQQIDGGREIRIELPGKHCERRRFGTDHLRAMLDDILYANYFHSCPLVISAPLGFTRYT